jgi:hypothetical protein
MIRFGVRRCDLCASEMLGRGGPDICFMCRLCEEDKAGAADEKQAANVAYLPWARTASRWHPQRTGAANDDHGPRPSRVAR